MMASDTETAIDETATRPRGNVLFLVTLGALALRLIPLSISMESTDILLYRQQAVPVLLARNVYAVTRNVFPYTPVSMFFPALLLDLSGSLGVPFDILIKLFVVAADAGIAAVLYGLGARVVGERRALTGAALYALNPVSILVASFHGNVMPLVVLLMLAAYLLYRADPRRHLTASALLLGLAVGWRSFPVLLLPFFLVEIEGWVKRLRFAAWTLVPVALSVAPFAWIGARPMFEAMLGYSGWGIHHGPFAVLRGLHLLSLGRVTWDDPPEWAAWVGLSKIAFLSLYGLLLLGARRRGLLHGILASLLLFQVVYAGVASQYLVWVVPFLLLVEGRALFWCYEATATYALVVFYWTFFPDILWGTLAPPRASLAPMLWQYVVSEALLSAVCAAGVVVFATRRAPSSVPARTPAEAPVVSGWRPGVAGLLVGLYYAALYVWEIAFVATLG
jgi:hypothetical protein